MSADDGGIAGFGLTIERSSTVRAVADSLREAILSGSISPGTALREVALANELGVSRNTVREAARVLEGEGLVRHQLSRGVEVTDLSDDDIVDIYAARQAVELAGLDALLKSGDRALFGELEKLVAVLEAAEAEGDLAAALEGDRRFHAVLVSATGSMRLAAWHASLQQELRLALTLAQRSSAELGRREDEHRQLLAAIRDRTRAQARQALTQHLQAGAAELQRLRQLVHSSPVPQGHDRRGGSRAPAR